MKFSFLLCAFLSVAIPCQANEEQTKALLTAAEKGDEGEVKSLITQGVDVNSKGPGPAFKTAIGIAAYSPHTKMVQLLLESGANANSLDPFKETLMIKAIKFYIREAVDLRKVEEDRGSKENALLSNLRAVIRILIKHGAQIDAKNFASQTALILLVATAESTGASDAEKKELFMLIRDLLYAGADPEIKNSFGQQAIDLATKDSPIYNLLYDFEYINPEMALSCRAVLNSTHWTITGSLKNPDAANRAVRELYGQEFRSQTRELDLSFDFEKSCAIEKRALQIINAKSRTKAIMGSSSGECLSQLSEECAGGELTRIFSLCAKPKNMEKEKPNQNQQFENAGIGIVTDRCTRISWETKPTPKEMTWQQAKANCEKLRTGRFSDWRLPAQFELETLAGNKENGLDSVFEVSGIKEFWSSSPSDTNNAHWTYNFDKGSPDEVLDKAPRQVICVR